jgi:hypothetical protein
MRGAVHVQGPKKFACQNEALFCLLPAGEHALAPPPGKFIFPYQTLSPVPVSPCGSQENSLHRVFVPPILAAQIFPSPGQRRKPIPQSTGIFRHIRPPGMGGFFSHQREKLPQSDENGVPRGRERRGISQVEIDHLLHPHSGMERGGDHIDALGGSLATYNLAAQ